MDRRRCCVPRHRYLLRLPRREDGALPPNLPLSCFFQQTRHAWHHLCRSFFALSGMLLNAICCSGRLSSGRWKATVSSLGQLLTSTSESLMKFKFARLIDCSDALSRTSRRCDRSNEPIPSLTSSKLGQPIGHQSAQRGTDYQQTARGSEAKIRDADALQIDEVCFSQKAFFLLENTQFCANLKQLVSMLTSSRLPRSTNHPRPEGQLFSENELHMLLKQFDSIISFEKS